MQFKSVKEMKEHLYKRTLLDEIRYYGFYCWWNYLDMLWRRIYWFFQRGYRGYGDNDTWDFDAYLSTMIPKALKQLKKYHHGIPPEIYDKYRYLNNFHPGTQDELAKKEWNEILDKIINGFESAALLINEYDNLDDNERIFAEQIINEGFDLFKEWFFYLWD